MQASVLAITRYRGAPHHFILIVGVQVAQSICTLALLHSRVKIPLFGAVSLQTLSTGSPCATASLEVKSSKPKPQQDAVKGAALT